MWAWFGELDRARSSGFGFEPISFADIKSWSDLTGVDVSPWEVKAIRAMDDLRLPFLNKSKEEPTVSSRPMSPQLFDALLETRH